MGRAAIKMSANCTFPGNRLFVRGTTIAMAAARINVVIMIHSRVVSTPSKYASQKGPNPLWKRLVAFGISAKAGMKLVLTPREDERNPVFPSTNTTRMSHRK
jgi:hypothetical protein